MNTQSEDTKNNEESPIIHTLLNIFIFFMGAIIVVFGSVTILSIYTDNKGPGAAYGAAMLIPYILFIYIICFGFHVVRKYTNRKKQRKEQSKDLT